VEADHQPFARELFEVAVHRDGRYRVLRGELRQRRAAQALDALEDPGAADARGQRLVGRHRHRQ
jgi:hypothetical protein